MRAGKISAAIASRRPPFIEAGGLQSVIKKCLTDVGGTKSSFSFLPCQKLKRRHIREGGRQYNQTSSDKLRPVDPESETTPGS